MDIEKVKKFIFDKKNRPVVKLGMYFIFFIIMAIICRMYPGYKQEVAQDKKLPVNVVSETPLEKYGKFANYEYTLNYSLNDTDVLITGKVFRKDNYFTMNNQTYYEKDKVYLMSNDTFTETTINELYLIKPGQIRNYIDKAKLVSKQEDYENNSIISKYSLPVSTFDTSIISDDLVYISIYEKEKNIFKVELDLSNYIKIKDNIDVTSSLLTIEYTNIGQVPNFIDMFDESKVIKKEF